MINNQRNDSSNSLVHNLIERLLNLKKLGENIQYDDIYDRIRISQDENIENIKLLIAEFNDRFGEFTLGKVQIANFKQMKSAMVNFLFQNYYKKQSKYFYIAESLTKAIKAENLENIKLLISKTELLKHDKIASKIFKIAAIQQENNVLEVLADEILKYKKVYEYVELKEFTKKIIKHGNLDNIKYILDKYNHKNAIELIRTAIKQQDIAKLKLLMQKFNDNLDEEGNKKLLGLAIELKNEEVIFYLKEIFLYQLNVDRIYNEFLKHGLHYANEGLILLKFSQNDKLCDMFFDKNKINIGIGEGESSIYSDGLFDLFIKLSIVKEKLEFYIVTNQVADLFHERCGIEIYKYFNGWINPGSQDKYPLEKEFSFKEYGNMPKTKSEEVYFKFLSKTEEYKIPYIGICGGAQTAILHHGGYLSPTANFENNTGDEDIVEYIKGSFAYYMTLSKHQQEKLIKKCIFPEVKFSIDRNHEYAAVSDSLGDGMILS